MILSFATVCTVHVAECLCAAMYTSIFVRARAACTRVRVYFPFRFSFFFFIFFLHLEFHSQCQHESRSLHTTRFDFFFVVPLFPSYCVIIFSLIFSMHSSSWDVNVKRGQLSSPFISFIHHRLIKNNVLS